VTNLQTSFLSMAKSFDTCKFKRPRREHTALQR